ncbi:MAG: T9SS type A sorting domain-containing protein [Bacteroidia bacterium]|nr:T9SS type A sorting domain-containing protein [Bacteroidia bacterium]
MNCCHILLYLLLFESVCNGATCSPNKTPANWSTAADWTCGHVPTNGDVVLIPVGFQVRINGNIMQGTDVIIFQIYGTLNFPTTNDKILINEASVINIYGGGSVTATSASNQIRIGAGPPEWSGPGTLNGPVVITNGVLPIELVFFLAKLNKDCVQLSWQTASETNNDYFSIECSVDGNTYETLQNIKGANNSISIINYSFTDSTPIRGTSYYRLKQTDYDGKYSYSNICAIEYNTSAAAFQLNVYPNPSYNNMFTVSIDNINETQNVFIVIKDIMGNEIYSKANLNINNNTITGDEIGTKLASGIYFITATSKMELHNQKLIIK